MLHASCRNRNCRTKFGFRKLYPFADHFKSERNGGPIETGEKSIKLIRGTPAAKLHAMESSCEVKKMTVHVPLFAGGLARPNPRSVGLEDHALEGFQLGGGIFPSASEIAEKIDVEAIHSKTVNHKGH